MIHFRIEQYSELDSTNTVALKQASNGEKEGKVIVADFQTNGRGKPGNAWVSPPEQNLLFSLLLRPPIEIHKAPMITQIACRSVAKVLDKNYGIKSTFKRPNDVMVDGKKICGVLVESQSKSSGKLESAVIGIGLNLNSDPKDLVPESTSVKAQKGQVVNRDEALQLLLKQLREDVEPFYA